MKDFGCADCVHVYKSKASNCNCWCHKQRSENTQPWSNLCLCLQKQFLDAFSNIYKRYLCSSTISFANQMRVPYLYLGAYLRVLLQSMKQVIWIMHLMERERRFCYTLTQRNDVICNQRTIREAERSKNPPCYRQIMIISSYKSCILDGLSRNLVN